MVGITHGRLALLPAASVTCALSSGRGILPLTSPFSKPLHSLESQNASLSFTSSSCSPTRQGSVRGVLALG